MKCDDDRSVRKLDGRVANDRPSDQVRLVKGRFEPYSLSTENGTATYQSGSGMPSGRLAHVAIPGFDCTGRSGCTLVMAVRVVLT